jgi:CubicO group peptidase (beta-lactamase class C family)
MELAWANAHVTARGLARVYAALAHGGSIGEVRLLSSEAIDAVRRRRSWGIDRVLHKPMGFSLGFVKEEPHLFSPNPESFGHPGAGGALGWADPTRHVAIGYVMNRMSWRLRSPRALALCHAIYASLRA